LRRQLRARREILAGQALAAFVHPIAAWRLWAKAWRVWILMAYTAVGYVAVLGALLAR
jgi:hypothetical protein